MHGGTPRLQGVEPRLRPRLCAAASMQDGSCTLADNCPYSHNVFEYWLHPTRCATAAGVSWGCRLPRRRGPLSTHCFGRVCPPPAFLASPVQCAARTPDLLPSRQPAAAHRRSSACCPCRTADIARSCATTAATASARSASLRTGAFVGGYSWSWLVFGEAPAQPSLRSLRAAAPGALPHRSAFLFPCSVPLLVLQPG